MNLHLIKMQGCGNDFLIYDALLEESPHLLTPNQIVNLCDRHFGVGADGFLTLKKSNVNADAVWDFYNSDGSSAEMCGNAARCVIKLLKEKHYPRKEWISLQTVHGVIQGRVLSEDSIQIEMPNLKSIEEPFEEKLIRFEHKVLQGAFLNTGVPHLVIEVEKLETFPITTVGKFLVGHEMFSNGTNVTFLEKVAYNQIKSVTFERGVEEPTLACGTGVVAAAIIYHQLYAQDFPIEVAVPGGRLKVIWDSERQKVLLEGPAKYVAEVDTYEI